MFDIIKYFEGLYPEYDGHIMSLSFSDLPL